MANSLKEELASLKIDRRGNVAGSAHLARSPRRPGREGRPRGGGPGMALLALGLWVVPLGLIAAGSIYAYRQYQTIRSKPSVSVALVQAMTSGEAEKLLSAKGYLKSRNQSSVGARIPGRLQELRAEEGTRVKKGQVLAILEHNDLDASLDSRKAMALKAQADVQEARADLELRKQKADRAQRLQNRNMSVSVEELQQNVAAVEMGAAHLAAMEASLKLQNSQVREVEESLVNMTIRAPFDGTVVEKPAEVGEMITGGGMGSGLSIGRSAVLTVANLDMMDVETDVAENLLSRITVGQPAEVSVAAVPSKHYRGRLRQIIPISDRSRGTVKVKVEILEPDDKLFPELVATVHFLPDKTHQGPDVGKSHLFVTKSALFDEGGHSHVWVVDPKSNLRKTRVEVTVTTDDLARVESGLKAGESVVLSPGSTLRDGEPVKIAD